MKLTKYTITLAIAIASAILLTACGGSSDPSEDCQDRAHAQGFTGPAVCSDSVAQ